MTAAGDDHTRDSTGASATLRLLANRNFGPYFVGSLLSNSGTWFQNLAQGILVYRLTGSTVLLGVVGFSQFVAVLVLAPWTGAAADHFDRRVLMRWMQLGSFVVTAVLAVLAWKGLATAGVVIGLALLLGVATAFSTPAMQALVPQLVEREQLSQAIGLNSVSFNAARVIGPIVGAVVISQLGIPWAFALNSGSYLVLVLALSVVKLHRQPPRPKQRPLLRETIRLAAADPRILALLVATATLSLTLDPVSTLAPAYATQVLHRPDTLAGWLIGVFGAGSVIAVFLFTGRIAGSWRRLAGTLTLMGGGVAAYALAPNLEVALVALFIAGLGFLSSSTATTIWLLRSVDVSQHGRFMAIWSALFLGLRPIAALIDGSLAAVAGVRASALVLALPTLGVAAWLFAGAAARSQHRPPA